MPWPVWAVAIDGSTTSRRPWLGRDLGDDAREEVQVLAVDRGDERAAAAGDQRRRLALVAIGHDRRGGAEHLDLVHGLRGRRVLHLQQSRRDEGGRISVDAVERWRLGSPQMNDASAASRRSAVERRRLLRPRHHRTHAHVVAARIAESSRLELRAERLGHGVGRSAGTKMRRMAVHFCPALIVISRTTSRTNASNASPPPAASGASTPH